MSPHPPTQERAFSPAIGNAAKNVSNLARRIHGWTWQTFPIGMGTGAVYITLSGVRDRPRVVLHIEHTLFFLNIALFLLNSLTLLVQLFLYPRQFLRLIRDPAKGLFVPLVVLSFATILIGTIQYYAAPVGFAQPSFIYGLFWVYLCLSLIICFPMLVVWFSNPHDLSTFTPAWAFLVFPMMLVGVVASNVLKVIPPEEHKAIGVLLVGYAFQGLGSIMTFFYLCIYVMRIMMTGFMDGHQANGAFVAVGPPGFTALALIDLGDHARNILPQHGIVSTQAGEVWYAASVMSGIILFGLAAFFFVLAILPYRFKAHKHLSEVLGCWALTFPNVGFIATIRLLADIFDLQPFYVWYVVMVALMCCAWFVLFLLTLVAFWRGEILMAKPEDVAIDIMSSTSPERWGSGGSGIV